MDAKYVMFDEIFFKMWFGPENHNKQTMVTAFGTEMKITSAGMIKIVDGKVKCYGKSTTLGMGPAENDAKIIQRYL